jgi:hypothetical protein
LQSGIRQARFSSRQHGAGGNTVQRAAMKIARWGMKKYRETLQKFAKS